VVVDAQVKGDGNPWYRLDTGEYVSGDQIRLPGTPAASFSGKWIDANLNDPTVVTAYEGDRPVASTLAIRGVAAWQTPVGTYRIWRRVANETMSSDGLGIPRNAPGGYYVENVLFTQYFSPDGAALHYNYWSSMWGYPGSHGCLGMNYDDAAWFWNWAEVGTPVVVHY
jgi:lipoprotein-anchoring transpeptidase ErfK/SrfK